MTTTLEYNQPFEIVFENGNTAKAVCIPVDSDPSQAVRALGFVEPQPVIFISGGASRMMDEDKWQTKRIIQAVAEFAEERDAVIVDGGTETGVMEMIGDVRHEVDYQFPLIGVSPLGKVSFPGYENPNEEAFLEDRHSHFILVDGDDWGIESKTILRLTDVISGEEQKPAVGILINGGQVALHEVYLASTRERRLSVIVVEGSGRSADDISTAVRSGKSTLRIVKAILAGGSIELVGTNEGPEAMISKLAKKFDVT